MKPARSLDGERVKSGVHQAIQEIIFQSNLRSVGGAMARTKRYNLNQHSILQLFDGSIPRVEMGETTQHIFTLKVFLAPQ